MRSFHSLRTLAKISLVGFLVAWCGVPPVRADDIAEVRREFQAYIEYQRTDDERLLDQLASDMAVTIILVHPKGDTETLQLTAAQFRKVIADALSQKTGSKDAYEKIGYAPVANGVLVTCTVLQADMRKRVPFSVVYARDEAGRFKMKLVKMTIAGDK